MQGMMDLGRFGDERLQKGGPIFWPLLWVSGRRVCVSLEAIEPTRSASGVFCTILL